MQKSILILTILFASTRLSYASTLSVEVLNLTPSIKIESVTLVWNVGDSFKISGGPLLGQALPPAKGDSGWEQAASIVDSFDNTYTWGAANFGYLLDDQENPIVSNGAIVSFDYAGNILGFKDILFFDKSGTNTYNLTLLNPTTFVQDGSAKFAPVPIPAALWLLGSGLVGLVAIRRRRS